MKRMLAGIAAIGLSLSVPITIVHAQESAEEAVPARKALMQANGAVAALGGAMMKGEMEYQPAVAKAVIATFRAVSLSIGSHFPAGSQDVAGSRASSAIWENATGFAELVAKLQADTAAAVEASGKDGPADLASFQAAVSPIMRDCQTCHEQFRVSN